jgi:hypothetical protein
MKSLPFPFAALLAVAVAVCGTGAAFASGAEAGGKVTLAPSPVEPSGAKADRRAPGVPVVPRSRPSESARSSATYDAGDVQGKKIAFIGTASFIGNEPHTTLVVRPEGQNVAYRVLPEDAARDLAQAQGRRLAIEALALEGSVADGSIPAIHVLAWKIVK